MGHKPCQNLVKKNRREKFIQMISNSFIICNLMFIMQIVYPDLHYQQALVQANITSLQDRRAHLCLKVWHNIKNNLLLPLQSECHSHHIRKSSMQAHRNSQFLCHRVYFNKPLLLLLLLINLLGEVEPLDFRHISCFIHFQISFVFALLLGYLWQPSHKMPLFFCRLFTGIPVVAQS